MSAVTFTGISGHVAAIPAVTFAGPSVTIPESPVTLDRNTHLVYIVGGLFSASIDIGVLQLMMAVGTDPLLAATAGFFSGLLFNFTFHANLTFRSTTSVQAFIHYLAVVGLNYSITMLFIYISFSVLHQGVLPGKILSLPIVAANGYLLGKYWIFK